MYQGFQVCPEMGINLQSLLDELPNEIINHMWWDGGPSSIRIGCTKFYKECTKFCKWCTKGSKVRPDVGDNHQSLPNGFLNEIMDHTRWDGGPSSIRIGYIKFYKGCTTFCKWCTEVGIDLQSLLEGFPNEIIGHIWWDGGPNALGLDVPNFIKNIPNFVKDVQSASRGGNRPPITFVWVPKWNNIPDKWWEGGKFCYCWMVLQAKRQTHQGSRGMALTLSLDAGEASLSTLLVDAY